VHYFFVIWLQYLMLGVGVFAVAKGIFVSAASLLLSWGTANAFGFWPGGRTSFTRRNAPAAAAIATQHPSNETALPDKL
jgi:hypothetical protein